MEHKKGNVASLGQSLKETIPVEFKERAQQAIQDSVKIAEEGKCWLGHLQARLEFRSADSEAGSYKGPIGLGAAADPRRQLLGGAPEGRKRTGEDSMSATDGLVALLRGWGQLKANDSVWPTFDGRYANYPRSRRNGRPTGRHTTPW
jgi:hypothetical protein